MSLLLIVAFASLVPAGCEFDFQQPSDELPVQLAAARYVKAIYKNATIGLDDSTGSFTSQHAGPEARYRVHPPSSAAALAEVLKAKPVRVQSGFACLGSAKEGCVDIVVRIGQVEIRQDSSRIWIYIYDLRNVEWVEQIYRELEVIRQDGDWYVTRPLQSSVSLGRRKRPGN